MHIYNFVCIVRQPTGVYDTTLSVIAANEEEARALLLQRPSVIHLGDCVSVDGEEITR